MITADNQKPSYTYLLTFILMCMICIPALLQAQMSELPEDELSYVSAQSGINYVIGESQHRITLDSYRISDTDHDPANWMEFNNITIDDGMGGYFSMDTPNNEYDFNTMDVATDLAGRTMVYMNLSTHVEPRTYSVGNFVFCNQDLGSLLVSNLTLGASDSLIFGGRLDGGSGIDMEYQTQMDIDSFTYTYNFNSQPNFPRSLVLSGIHLSQYSLGSPEDPTSWVSIGKFKFGDFANDNPMTIDVGTTDGNVTSAFINIPMTGTARVENVEFHEQDFGPVAIDGINVHHLGILIPGN